MSSLGDLPVDFQGNPRTSLPPRSCRSSERRDTTLRRLLASKTSVAGAVILLFWICAAIFGTHFTKRPYATGETAHGTLQHVVRDRQGRARRIRAGNRRRARLIIASLATLLGIGGGTILGP